MRFEIIAILVSFLSLFIFIIFCISLFFSYNTAFWIYISGCMVSALSWFYEVRNIRYYRECLGREGATRNVQAKIQPGVEGFLQKFLTFASRIFLWPDGVRGSFIGIYYYFRDIPLKTFIRHSHYLSPRFTHILPIILFLSLILFSFFTYNPVSPTSLISLIILYLIVLLYLVTLGVVKLQVFVSRNIIHPMINAILIALQLWVISVLMISIAAPIVDKTAVNLSFGLTQMLDISTAWDTVQNGMVSFFGHQSITNRDTVYASIMISVLVIAVYFSAFKAVLSGAIYGRTEDGHIDIAEYFLSTNKLHAAEKQIKKVAITNPQRHLFSAKTSIANRHFKRAEEAAGRFLRSKNCEDSTSTRWALLCMIGNISIPDNMGVDQKTELIQQMVDHMLNHKVPGMLIALLIRNCLSSSILLIDELSVLKEQLLATEEYSFVGAYLELFGFLLLHPGETDPDLFDLARQLADESADISQSAIYFYPMLLAWNHANNFGALPPQANQDSNSPEVDTFLEKTMQDARQLGQNAKPWQCLVLWGSVGYPLLARAVFYPFKFVNENDLLMIDDWHTQLSNSGFDEMDQLDFEKLLAEFSK